MCLCITYGPKTARAAHIRASIARPCQLHHSCARSRSDAVDTSSRDARNNKRALELLAAAAEITQAVRLAADPLRDGAAVPERGAVVRGRRARVW